MNVRDRGGLWFPEPAVVEQIVERGKRARLMEREVEPVYDEREGHCWRCSHLTHNEDRTCDFCVIEVVREAS